MAEDQKLDQQKEDEQQEQQNDEKLDNLEVFEKTPDELEEMEQKLENEDSEIQSAEEVKPDESKTPEEKTPDKVDDEQQRTDKHGNPITGDPVKDLQSSLTRTQQQFKELQEKHEALKLKAEKGDTPEFKELSKEELENLKFDDPDKYAEYKVDKYKHDTHVETESANTREAAVTELNESVMGFLAKNSGLSLDNPAHVTQLEAAMKNADSDEIKLLKQLDEHLTANVIPTKIVDDIPVYSQAQLENAHLILNKETIFSDMRQKAREGTLESIENAANGGSPLDRLPAADGAGGRGKKPEDYTQEEILNMTPEQTEQLEKELSGG